MAELIDAKGYATNLFHMSIAAGRPSEKRIRKIMDAMNQLHRVMSDVHSHKEGLTVPPSILEKLEVASWKDALSDFKLPPANRENLSEWLNVLESWYAELPDRYQTLRDETLDELLAAEAQISEYYLSGEEAAIAPNLVAAPETYTTRVRGTERELQKRLDWWSRFTLADGKGPAIVRLGVAASIVGGVILLGTLAGSAKLMICNGLTVPVLFISGEHSRRNDSNDNQDRPTDRRIRSGLEPCLRNLRLQRCRRDINDRVGSRLWKRATKSAKGLRRDTLDDDKRFSYIRATAKTSEN